MTPEDLNTVERSWAQIAQQKAPVIAALASHFSSTEATPGAAEQRASWLFCAVNELVGLLSAPSQLADRARVLGEAWPDPLVAPCFAIDGRAWMAAGCECLESWSDRIEAAWRQAWLLLSDVLAAETLSPFADLAAPTGFEPVPPP